MLKHFFFLTQPSFFKLLFFSLHETIGMSDAHPPPSLPPGAAGMAPPPALPQDALCLSLPKSAPVTQEEGHEEHKTDAVGTTGVAANQPRRTTRTSTRFSVELDLDDSVKKGTGGNPDVSSPSQPFVVPPPSLPSTSGTTKTTDIVWHTEHWMNCYANYSELVSLLSCNLSFVLRCAFFSLSFLLACFFHAFCVRNTEL